MVGPLLVPADQLLARAGERGRGRQEGVHHERVRRRDVRARALHPHPADRLARLRGSCSRGAPEALGESTRRSPCSSRSASSAAPRRSRRRSRSTPGSRTRWRARRPVSALIHAATMVTAGVYLIARTSPLFELAPTSRTSRRSSARSRSLVAGLIALVQTDIKRVIAYSTMSQIGYMFLAVGLGAYGAGIFHLMTHAFFKALLFLAAGVVIHALAGEQDIRRMGGLGARAALDVPLLPRRRARARRDPAVRRLLLEGRDPRERRERGRTRLDALGLRRGRRLPDGPLHVPARLRRLPATRRPSTSREPPPQGALRGAARDDVAGRRARRPRRRRRASSRSRASGTRSTTGSSPSPSRSRRRPGATAWFSALAALGLALLGIVLAWRLYGRAERRARADPRTGTAGRPGARGASSRSSGSTGSTTSSSTAPRPVSPPGSALRRAAALPHHAHRPRLERPWALRPRRRRADGRRPRLRAHARGRARRPRRRLPGGLVMLTTALIVLPVAGALLLWLLPLGERAGGRRPRAPRRARRALALDRRAPADRLRLGRAPALDRDRLVRGPRRLVQGRALRLLALARRPDARSSRVAAIAYGIWAGRERPRAYFGLLLFLAGATVGVFTAQDLLLFYVFFEAMLIPLYVLIGVWGGVRRTAPRRSSSSSTRWRARCSCSSRSSRSAWRTGRST